MKTTQNTSELKSSPSENVCHSAEKRVWHTQFSPELADILVGRIALTWTRHAQEQAVRKGVVLHDGLNLPAGSVVEAAYEGGRLRLVVRYAQSRTQDAVLVLLFIGRGAALVKTAWINACTDTHVTLRTARFDRARSA